MKSKGQRLMEAAIHLQLLYSDVPYDRDIIVSGQHALKDLRMRLPTDPQIFKVVDEVYPMLGNVCLQEAPSKDVDRRAFLAGEICLMEQFMYRSATGDKEPVASPDTMPDNIAHLKRFLKDVGMKLAGGHIG